MAEATAPHEWSDKKVRDWVMMIKEDLKQHALEMQAGPKPVHKMFRVRPNLRQLKPEHYDAEQISLGLFDRSPFAARKTRPDQCRVDMAHAFLRVMGMTEEDDWEKLCELVVPNPKEMQDQYDELGRDNLSLKEVQTVLALDSIFVACFLSSKYDEGFANIFPEFTAVRDCMVPILTLDPLIRDLFKVENQIPLSLVRTVLLILVEKIQPGTEPQARIKIADEYLVTICVNIIYHVSDVLPGYDPENSEFGLFKVNYVECDHFLDCLYRMMCHGLGDRGHLEEEGSVKREARATDTSNGKRTNDRLRCFLYSRERKERSRLRVLVRNVITRNKKKPEIMAIPPATLLQKAGIEFQGIRDYFHKVEFKPGLLKRTLCLPTLIISDGTEPFWRNIVAYEDVRCTDDGNQEFTSYLAFMDELIESQRDVTILKSGVNNSTPVICEDYLGDGRAVARVFNNTILKNSIIVSGPTSDKTYKLLREDIYDFYIQDRRRLVLEFIQTKFGKPWLIISVVAATILLVLTFLQTYYAAAGYYHAS